MMVLTLQRNLDIFNVDYTILFLPSIFYEIYTTFHPTSILKPSQQSTPNSTHTIPLHLIPRIIRHNRRKPNQWLPPHIPHILTTRADPSSGPPLCASTYP